VTENQETLPPHYRWNFGAFLVDYFTFNVALNFFNPNSMLPSFVGVLTDSAPVIGAVSTVFSGSWLLPQLIGARIINDKPRKKPYLLVGISGRILFWIIALGLGLGLGRTNPSAMLALFFACLALWATLDGLGSVAWFEILARAIPSRRRGRLIGTAQVLGGLAGIGAGWMIGRILERNPFPNNYTLIFALAGTLLIPSTVALLSLREVRNDDTQTPKPNQAVEKGPWFKHLIAWFKLPFVNPAFRHLMTCRILVGMMGLATPFYVQYATKELTLSPGVIGSFVMAQTIGGVAASAILSPICERRGTRPVIRIGSAAATMGPLFALIVHTYGTEIAFAYPLIYVFLGIINSTWVMGFFNYLLEIAPDDLRPTYIGISNFVMGTLTLTPMLGGWLLERTSYSVLFGLAAVLVAMGFLFSLGLRPSLSIKDSS
jgi:MFS family permease